MIGAMKLKPDILRTTEPTKEQLDYLEKHKKDIYIVCDNVLDTYNVGAIFRLADAVSAKKVYLCGSTETPPNTRIKKASINTWNWVEWQYTSTAIEVISNIKNQISNIKIVAIEQYEESIPYYQADYSLPIALVVGNETNGISKEVLNMCDQIVELPMFGINKSLNVMVSLGIILYEILEKNNVTA